MKRVFALILSILMLVSLLPGCQKAPEAPETTKPAPTESPEEAQELKIMILGSSRSVNTFQLLWNAFQDQMPDQKVTLGIMYYSGCSIHEHVKFVSNNEAAYNYYLNNNGKWVITDGVTMDVGLLDQAWDVILLQAGDGDLAGNMNEIGRKYLVDYVNDVLEHPHVFWWHSTWFNSADPDLYPNRVYDMTPDKQIEQLTASNDAAKKYVLEDPMFEGRITSGTPMLYAVKELKIADKELFRDHTHLSDFGCLLVAYAFYAQYTGKEVTEINLETIPAHLRHKSTQHLGDLVVTEEMKDAIIKTVKYTLENPWAVPTGK